MCTYLLARNGMCHGIGTSAGLRSVFVVLRDAVILFLLPFQIIHRIASDSDP
ncbi:hypothetical protein HYPSUDRAFT_36287 [Hypholoma sublateritium FD-334 SS-4]|uniref:Uncharacterized protein n=1 Tax=Hypholoma sublateritium (strain FD-334 SS-4) TaxID=945553 RepID=A0A0D2MRE7_HYPSF|nr:hypothetical protein HYPSUDRAFT_36287 [Hypholoma sublateritium FD-334 SS-4]